MTYLLGLDLGGTKCAAIVGNERGEIVYRTSAPTPAGGSADQVLHLLVRLVREAHAHVPHGGVVEGVGVSAGAPADARTGRVFDAPNLPSWNRPDGFPLADFLSQALNDLPVRVENDANATALAEWRFGAGKEARNLAFLTVGTGIGAGLILDGRLHRGANNAAGEIGHVMVEPNGRLCNCGLRGCLEAYASGPSIAKIAVENGFSQEPSAKAVIAAARTDDPAAKSAVHTAAEMLGRGLAILAMLCNPEVIVLGTLAVHAGDLLLPTIRRRVRELTWPSMHENLRIVPAGLGDRAQDLAALCVWQNGQE